MQILINNKEVNKKIRDRVLETLSLNNLSKKKLWVVTSLPFGKGEILDIVDSYSKAQRRAYTRFRRRRKAYYHRLTVINNRPSSELIQTILKELQQSKC